MSAEGDADPRDGVHHPRRRSILKGHEKAERVLLKQYLSGRMHHGWLISGPRGIGKATLAYRLARFILHYPSAQALGDQQSLGVAADAAVSRLVASGGHPDLIAVERRFDPKTGKIKTEIAVDDVRRAGEFFGRTSAADGWRICIVDAADELNAESANALLKTLEEPPGRSLIILVSHQPRRLLPTLRSRCIELPVPPISEQDTIEVLNGLGLEGDAARKAAALSRGSPGRALEIVNSAGARAFDQFAARMERAQFIDIDTKLGVADAFQNRGTAADFVLFCELLIDWTARRARDAASAGRGARWALAHDTVSHSIRQADALNLDRRQTVLDALTTLEEAARAA
jgi:DNA polymerase III subunit delta'